VSRYEGFGLPVLEAMACGVPCVVSDNTSLPEVAGDAALLVHPDDAPGLRQAIHRLLADDSLRAELAAKALARAASFDWERSASQVIEVYRTVCAAA
jgi:glycosyltransferase involved in cell wall biosynthesis